MKKFKIGDKVKIKYELIKWYLSDEGQGCYFPSSGILDEVQEEIYDNMMITMLTLAMGNNISAEVIGHNYPNSDAENYRVLILSSEFNIQPYSLIKVNKV